MSGAQIHRLSNGVRVVVDPMPGLESAALGVWIEAGARDESRELNGVAHLFEHMAFKGAGARDARALAEAFESVGASANAATGYERTAYFARALSEHAPAALELILDMLLEPRWLADELEREKQVVLQELAQAKDDPEDCAFELHQACVFDGQPLGRSILGSAETLARIEVQTLTAFQKSHFTANSIVVSLAGRFDEARALSLCEARLGSAPARPKPERQAGVAREGVRIEAKRSAQAHLALSWAGPSLREEALASSRVLAEILGGGMASRLFQEVREERGLAYAIDCFLDVYSDVGRLCVYAGCPSRAAASVIEVCLRNLLQLANDGPTDWELQRAKAAIASQLLMGAESAAARAEARAAQLLTFGRVIELAEVRAQVEAVTVESVALSAQEALRGAACAGAVGARGVLQGALEQLANLRI